MPPSIARSAGIILIINMAVKILGFLRETFIARGFGATWLTDSYLVAYTLPYFLQAILGYALVTVVVPVLTKYRLEEDSAQASLVGSSLINLMSILLAGLTIIGIIIAPGLVFITAPGLPPEAAALSVKLARIMFPSVVFMGVGMVITGILNSGFRFGWAAFAPGCSNLIIILGVVFFPGAGITGLAYATLISFLGLLLIQLPSLKKSGFKYTLVCDFRHPAVRGVLRDILPIVLGVAVNQIYFALNRVFASGLAEGSISALNYASKLMNLPVGIFVAAVASAIYPSLSARALEKDAGLLAETMEKGLGLVALVAIPSAVGLIVLRNPIVALLFERGAFDAQATQITAYALLFFCLGLVPVALNMVLTRAYYALGDVRTPVMVGLLSIIANIIASLLFLKPLGHGGLALANSLAALINTVILYLGLGKKIPGLITAGFGKALLKMLSASLIMALCLYAFLPLLKALGGYGSAWLALRIGVLVALGAAAYLLAAFFLKVKEIKELLTLIKHKILHSPGK